MKTRLLPFLLATAAALAVAAPLPAQTPTPTPAPAPNYVAQLRSNAPIVNATVEVPQLTNALFRVVAQFSGALWSNPTQAQAKVDALGEKAAPLFVAYGSFAGPLAVIDPATYAKLPKTPPGYGWTILPPQADGTWPVGQRSVLITHATSSP